MSEEKITQEEIGLIRKDLIQLNEKEFFSKYCLCKANWYLNVKMELGDDALHDALGRLKLIIVEHMPVSFNNIQIVGSSTLGYSLAPKKAFDKFRDDSDIDIALISSQLFMELWKKLRNSYDVKYTFIYNNIIKNIYSGYIDESDLMSIPSLRQQWGEKSKSSKKKIREEIGIPHEVNYRLYRSWDDFEDYQIGSIKELEREVQDVNSI